MDYDILNSAISDIIDIVNNYNRKHNYSIEVCEDLVISLTGFYLAFGPEIFSKIGQVLPTLELHCANNKASIDEVKQEVRGDQYLFKNDNPETIWKLVLDKKNNNFIGALPHIVYHQDTQVEEPLTLSHELSHVLEGCTAKVISEDDKTVTFRIGFSEVKYSKETGYPLDGYGHGMTELITVTVENKILKKFSGLDPENIDNPLVKDYVSKIKEIKSEQILANSYLTMAGIFKDLIDNDKFFNLIEKYYYETDQDGFIEEFDSMDKDLSFKRLVRHAESLCNPDDERAVLRHIPHIQTQLNTLNKVTNTTPSKEIVLVL